MFNIDKIYNKYSFNNKEKEEFYNIIEPIYESDEFQRRLTNEFSHHGSITLGEHILEVACLTYKKSKDKKLSVIVAMLHDMYTCPWQNRKIKTKFFNKHGFRHPLEAVINSIYYYPELFKDLKESEIIIDGIIHHMFPFPVRVFEENDNNNLELDSFKLLKKIDKKYIDMIIKSTKRGKIGKVSLCKSKYIPGKIVKSCDKKVSFHQIKNISSLTSLITGKNRKINVKKTK